MPAASWSLGFTLLLGLCRPALAEESPWLAPGVAAGTVAVMHEGNGLAKRCYRDPCNSISHLAVGGLVGWLVSERHGAQAGALSAVAVGVGKELADKHFDLKDAVMTSLGGLLSVSIRF